MSERALDRYIDARPAYTDMTTKGKNFAALKTLYDADPEKIYRIEGMWISTGQYGDQPVVVTDECLANLPGHMVEKCRQLMADPDVTREINAGLIGFKIYTYTTEKNPGKTFYNARIGYMDEL